MAKKVEATQPSTVPAFYLQVDGKEYGPFSVKLEEEVKRLYRYAGIDPRYANVPPGKLVVPKKVKRTKVVEPSLLESIDFMPVAKIHKNGWD